MFPRLLLLSLVPNNETDVLAKKNVCPSKFPFLLRPNCTRSSRGSGVVFSFPLSCFEFQVWFI